MALTLFGVLFMLQASAIAQTTASSSTTTTPSSQVTGSSQVLRPAKGESVTYASPYTIRWIPPNIPGSISIELWDTRSEGLAYSFTEVNTTTYNLPVACDGYLTDINCGKLAQRIPNTGEHVWDVTSTPFGFNSLSGQFTFYLAIYIQQASGSVFPQDSSPWYVKSGNFTIVTSDSSSTGISTGTSASTSTRSSTGSSEPTSLSSSSGGTSSTGTTVSKNAGEKIIVNQVMWTALCLLSTLAIW